MDNATRIIVESAEFADRLEREWAQFEEDHLGVVPDTDPDDADLIRMDSDKG